jgi:hypothetical protein
MDRLSTTEDHMANFMLIFRGGNAARAESPELLQQHTQKWFAWFEQLTKSGVFKGQAAPLEPGGKLVRGRGKTVSDGPFAEAKDLVGGYAIIEAPDLEAAVEIARGCPTYEKDGAVEVRPVRSMAA